MSTGIDWYAINGVSCCSEHSRPKRIVLKKFEAPIRETRVEVNTFHYSRDEIIDLKMIRTLFLRLLL